MTDDPWGTQQETFGSFLKAQRRLANLSLRDMAERTKVSNAYLSQIERGMHAPSVRVLRSIAKALDLSAEAMLAQAGLFEEEPPPDKGAGEPPATEAAIRRDPNLTSDQKEALLSVYRSYLAVNRGAADRGAADRGAADRGARQGGTANRGAGDA